jgi:hypothetical protein
MPLQDDNCNGGVVMPKSAEMIRQRLKHTAVPHGTSIPDGNTIQSFFPLAFVAPVSIFVCLQLNLLFMSYSYGHMDVLVM